MKSTLASLALAVACAQAQDPCPDLPSGLISADSALPDLFTFYDGSPVTTSEDWTCRQRELSHLLQAHELGEAPEAPEAVTASLSGDTLSISVSDNGASVSFSVGISGAGTTDSPSAAIIAYGAPSIPIPSGVATITFSNDDVAAQESASSRGQGLFYDLYGSSHSAGAMTAWAWGVSRILDALEAAPEAGIDPARVGVTGCSRNGKGAMVAGALEPRVALTLPQESGSGGAACWRISDWERDVLGRDVQTASQIITENVWLGTEFDEVASSGNAETLPFDHHSLAALVAPRGLYVMENADMEWLGATSTYGCMSAAEAAWAALGAGVDNGSASAFGYSQVGGNAHCQFPSSKQGAELTAFIDRFLLGGSGGGTDVLVTEANHDEFQLDEWVPWDVPSFG